MLFEGFPPGVFFVFVLIGLVEVAAGPSTRPIKTKMNIRVCMLLMKELFLGLLLNFRFS